MIVSPAQAAIAWAGRLYSQVSPLPKAEPTNAADEALTAYRRVSERYPSQRASIGIGNCLMVLGHYQEAQAAYERAALVGHPRMGQALVRLASQKADADKRLAIADVCALLAGERSVLQVEPLPGATDRWIVMFAKAKAAYWKDNVYHKPDIRNIRLEEIEFKDGQASPVGRAVEIQDNSPTEGCLGAVLYASRLQFAKDPVAIVYRDYGGADHDTTLQDLYALNCQGPKRVGQFWGAAPAEIFPATRKHGLLVVPTPTWKVWWPDVYEWRNGRFVFGNQSHPKLFQRSDWRFGGGMRFPIDYSDLRGADRRFYAEHGSPIDYGDLMSRAALEMVRGNVGTALTEWRSAERACLGVVHPEGKDKTRFADYGFYGKASENLKEILQRIRWIAKGDLNHALLYRPYDFDYEVPPFKLGNAEPQQ